MSQQGRDIAATCNHKANQESSQDHSPPPQGETSAT
jgi:hypothetical protein